MGLFDAYVYPVYYYKNPIKKKIVSIFYLLANMIFIFLNMFSSKKNFNRRIQLLKLLFNELKSGGHQQTKSLKKDTLLAINRYTMRPQDIMVDLFRAKEDVFFAHDFKFLGWKKLARKGIRKHMLPGNHLDMFDSPNVEVYARNLQQVLNEYDSDNYE